MSKNFTEVIKKSNNSDKERKNKYHHSIKYSYHSLTNIIYSYAIYRCCNGRPSWT